MKKFALLALFAVFSCTGKKVAKKNTENSTVVSAQQDSLNSYVTDTVFVEADAGFQWEANQKLEKLLGTFGTNLPDYYGGAFIDDDGSLVLNISGNLEKSKSEIAKIISLENVRFRQTEISQNALDAIMDQINQRIVLRQNQKVRDNFASAGSMLNPERIEVGLLNNAPEKQLEFRKNIVDSKFLVFIKSGRLVNQ